ncbi:MAG TPA: amidohydrolase family protein [Xanthobacteraceae bacterium]|jgi:predicted TIM-barrel fold metal-dependent hydrolase|nr:amidohydrolase family protein [Xanthobacteraceae bacterium]
MRTITLEEHFSTPAFRAGAGKKRQEHAEKVGGRLAKIVEQLADVGDKRIAEMDAAGIDTQVLSLTSPGCEQLEAADAIALSREANDFLAAAVKKYPKRFAGLAVMPTAAPDKAAVELEHMVRDHGFVGAVIHGHNRGRYFDNKFFWPILERAEALNVPIYLHPTMPPQAVIDVSFGGFAPAVTDAFAGSGWGWHIETAVHILRLVLGGVFDAYPKLQFVIGHLGEALPFMIQRFEERLAPALTKLQRPVSDYLRQNVNYTIAGFNFPPAFLDLLLEVGVDRIMFSADYPYNSMEAARAFLDQIPVSGADRERIAHGNAEKLFKLAP